MVETQEIRDAFAKRLNTALDHIPEIRPGRGRNTDLQAALERLGARATKQATHKWLTGASIPERDNMEFLANWLKVRVEWLEYGLGEMREQPADAGQTAAASSADIVRKMLEKHGKGLTEDARRKIVDAVEAEVPQQAAQQATNVIVGDFSRPGLVGDEIRIAHYDIRGAMGNGQVPADYMEMLRDVKVSESHLRKIGITFDDPNHLKMVYGWGHSMSPTIKHADPMIVDISIREFNGDGIFIFTWQGHLYIKRLQVQDAEHFEMISDNKQHKDRTIRMDETYIHARVLLVWNAHLV
ncbi:hypothetical protein Pssp01_29480 [Pseudomonas sp. NBRC 100443]|nr:hypothetical protein Pssp01_29480 [Pseudomonas sp. NBRC 100443]